MQIHALPASLFFLGALVAGNRLTPRQAAPAPEIAVVDWEKILDSSRYVQEMNAKLQVKNDEMVAELKKLQERGLELERKLGLMERDSEQAMRTVNEMKLIQTQIELDNKLRTSLMSKETGALAQHIRDEVYAKVGAYASKNGIRIVLKRLKFSDEDMAGVRNTLALEDRNPIVYRDDRNDITAQIISMLDANVPAKAPGAGAGAGEAQVPADAAAGKGD